MKHNAGQSMKVLLPIFILLLVIGSICNRENLKRWSRDIFSYDTIWHDKDSLGNDDECLDDQMLYFKYHHHGKLSTHQDSLVYRYCNLNDSSIGVFRRGDRLVYVNYDSTGCAYEMVLPKGFNFNHMMPTDFDDDCATFWSFDRNIMISIHSVSSSDFTDANGDPVDQWNPYDYRKALTGYDGSLQPLDRTYFPYKITIKQDSYSISCVYEDANLPNFYETGYFHAVGVGALDYVQILYKTMDSYWAKQIIANEIKTFRIINYPFIYRN